MVGKDNCSRIGLVFGIWITSTIYFWKSVKIARDLAFAYWMPAQPYLECSITRVIHHTESVLSLSRCLSLVVELVGQVVCTGAMQLAVAGSTLPYFCKELNRLDRFFLTAVSTVRYSSVERILSSDGVVSW